MKINLKYSYKFQILLIVVCLICQLILLQNSRAAEQSSSLHNDLVALSEQAGREYPIWGRLEIIKTPANPKFQLIQAQAPSFRAYGDSDCLFPTINLFVDRVKNAFLVAEWKMLWRAITEIPSHKAQEALIAPKIKVAKKGKK